MTANLVVCPHRGAAGYTRGDGRIHARPGSGGLVTALSGVDGGPVSARLLTVPPAVRRRWTHRIHPFDIAETAEALRDALRANAAPPELHATVAADSPADWIRRRLAALPC